MIKGAVLDWLGGPVWAIVRPALPFIAGAALVIAAWAYADHRGYQRGVASQQPTIAAYEATIANVRTATAKAQADDLAHKQAVEAQDARIAQEKTDALEKQLADARAAVADYVRLHAAPVSDPGSSGTAGVSFTPPAASPVAGAGGQAVLPVSDLEICADNTIKAAGWADWYAAIAKAPR